MKARRSTEPIKNVTLAQLDNYDPSAFDAVQQSDGTFTLVPLKWTNQAEFMDYAYGCGEPD